MPWDDEVPAANVHGTRAVTVDRPPASVWPWLAQLGYRRAGWYAFDFADNDNIRSAKTIIAELQHPRIGQVIGEEGYTIVNLEAPRRLVLTLHHPRVEWVVKGGLWPRFGDSSWGFFLESLDGGRRTRLLARFHYRVPLGLHLLWWPLYETVDLILQPLMLRRIKHRAERMPASISQVSGSAGAADRPVPPETLDRSLAGVVPSV